MGDVRPRQYVGVTGRRAAWLGSETGEAELWIHPLKLAQDFRIDFKVPQYVDPIRGADVARTVHVRPELTTIVYTHQSFTVRQHILAPLDDAALLVLLDVDATVPVDVVVSFRTVMQYAWPAGLGGQYTNWSAPEHAFLLSESRRQHNVLIGSPWAEAASTHPAHALPDAPSVFTIRVDADRARRELVPIAIVGGIEKREQTVARYRAVFGGIEAAYRERVRHAEALRDGSTSIVTPDARLNRAAEWAKVNLDEQLVCNPDLGCGLVAGWGPSGKGTRPGFGWFFGGDAAINSLAMSSTGLHEQVAQGLRFLARYQRDDGKIAHEIAQSAGRIPWFTEFPYAYYHADTTPWWIVSVWRYVRATDDRQLLAELWPHVRKAFTWGRGHDSDGDGLIENTTAGLGAIEVGAIGENLHQDVFLAAVWVEALSALTELAPLAGDEMVAREASTWHAKARASLNERYWIASAGRHAFGLGRSGDTNDALTVWPATAAAFGLLTPARADRTLAQIGGPGLTTDWGVRMLDRDHRLYDPAHYNMGAVWPFVTGFAAWGHYTYDRPWAAWPLVDAISQMTFDWARGRHPELFSGQYYRPLDEAVPQQFFATSMLLTPLTRGLLGWDANAPARRARLAPALPPEWARVEARRLRVGETSVDADIEQRPFSLTITIRASGPPVNLDLAPWLPPGHTNLAIRATEGGRALEASRATSGPVARPTVRIRTGSQPVSVAFSWRGGLAPIAPRVDLEPGQVSDGLRIVGFSWDDADGAWRMDVAGPPGRAFDIALRGVEARADGPAADALDYRDHTTRLRVRLPDDTARDVQASVRLVPASRVR